MLVPRTMSDVLSLRVYLGSGSVLALGSALAFGSAFLGSFSAGGWASKPATRTIAVSRERKEAARIRWPRAGTRADLSLQPARSLPSTAGPDGTRPRYEATGLLLTTYTPSSRLASSTPGAGLPYSLA